MRPINSSDLVFTYLTLFVSGFSAPGCDMFGSMASFSLLNLQLIQVIFDVLAQVAFALFLRFIFSVSSNFLSRNVIVQQVIKAVQTFKVQHGLAASRFFRFRGQLGYLQ